ncbi:MAG TPA: hypothetical protein PKB03_04760 [Baekduia sp.]|nr:hypothetical protein [Baekduia sp.]
MAPSPSAQLELTRRYARELRRLQAEAARGALGRSELTIRKARELAQGVVPPLPGRGPSGEEQDSESEVTPGVGTA